MNILKKEKNRKHIWISRGLLFALVGAVVLSAFYGVLKGNAEKSRKVVWNLSEDNVSWLYESSILLYRDLYNAQNETQSEYTDIYLQPKEDYEWLSDEEEPTNSSDEERDALYTMQDIQGSLNGYFEYLEERFSSLNRTYDYVMVDSQTGKYVTNMSDREAERMLQEDYNRYFLLTFQFDSVGNVSLGKVISENESELRKTVNEVLREQPLFYKYSDMLSDAEAFVTVKLPSDCTVVFAASADDMLQMNSMADEVYTYTVNVEGEEQVTVEMYRNANLNSIICGCILLFFLLGLLLPVLEDTKPWNDSKICSLPFEVLFAVGCLIFCMTSPLERMIVSVAGGSAAQNMVAYMPINMPLAKFFVGFYNLTMLTLFFFGFWYLGVCARALVDKGIVDYIRERFLIYRAFAAMKRKLSDVYRAVEHLDLTQDANKTILKLLLANAVILFVISLFWVGGVIMIVVYSAVLYLILRKYVSDLQKKYGILLEATNRMAEGNLNVTIEEDLGVFEPFKPQLICIQNGLKKAVEEEVKSQKMKAELITNVSHDLKTPLTAIITYVNLLQEENISEEQRKEYLDVLERKSLRLKVLIEDLFEVSKANSKNVTLNLTEVDIMNLIKQVSFEMSDKLSAAGVDVRMKLTEEKIMLSLDSQKTYRIYENLFGNIAKYAMKGTRVYVDGFRQEDKVIITLKNISAQEITVDSAELTERFVRGDAARNTEGSGLGLAIAKSFTELQGGMLTLETDGDLFKATTEWRISS